MTRVDRLPLDPVASAVEACHEYVTFASRDGIVLTCGWFPDAAADGAAVIVHPRARNRINSSFHPNAIARMLLSDRYSVLLFDRGGESGARATRWGSKNRAMSSAIDLAGAKAHLDRARVAAIGESRGQGARS